MTMHEFISRVPHAAVAMYWAALAMVAGIGLLAEHLGLLKHEPKSRPATDEEYERISNNW